MERVLLLLNGIRRMVVRFGFHFIINLLVVAIAIIMVVFTMLTVWRRSTKAYILLNFLMV